MYSSHLYNPLDGVSYPSHLQLPGSDDFLQHKYGPINPLYSDSLVKLCNSNQYSLNRLKEKLIEYDPCYQYDMKHWHKRHKESELLFSDSLAEYPRPDGIFADADKLNLKGWNQRDDQSGSKPGDVKTTFMCYLCSTLDEHKQHLARRGPQLKAKPKRKPRIQYIPPPPTVKRKEEVKEEKSEVLYKVIVRTGDKPNAATSANVSFSLKGHKGWMKNRQLKKKLAVQFVFGRGTTETFHIKGPKIGELQWLVIEHDGLEKKHGWYLEEIEIMNMNTSEIWLFPCKNYLSLFHGDNCIKRELKAQKLEVSDMEYEITVVTANKTMAGTDANVYITLYGKKGVSSKFRLQDKSKDTFEKGKKDVFHVTNKDLGALTSIRLEHDNTGKLPGWLVEQVSIQELEDPGRKYVFPCGRWFAKDEDDGQICRTLYPLKEGKLSGIKSKDGKSIEEEKNQITYEVDIVTGTKKYAGTDANIFIKMFGKLGHSKELEFRDENGKRFEKGATDNFRVRGDDVGDIKKIQLRHDNKGMAAGWFCKQVTMKRYFSKDEILERLSCMETELDENVKRRLSELAGEEVDLPHERRHLLKHQHSRSMDDDESNHSGKRRSNRHRSLKSSRNSLDRIEEEIESDFEERKVKKSKKKKISHKGKTMYVTDDDDSDSDFKEKKNRKSRRLGKDDDSNDNYDRKSRKSKDDDSSESDEASSRSHKQRKDDSSDDELENVQNFTKYQKDRMPFYDEYVFICDQWLAEDEGDGQIERILKPSSITTFYKLIKS